ncbi:MAG: sigma factor-like helix-turn-helix DNA-binding protein, partial [bacterium]
SLPRLLARTQRILTERPTYRKFIDAATTTAQWWGLADWTSPDTFQGSDSDLVSAAFSVGDIAVLRYGPESAIADPVLSTLDLERLVMGVFRQVGALLTLRHLDAAFRGRFAPWFEESSEPLEFLDESAPSQHPISSLEAEGVALRAIADLSERQLLVLRDRFESDMTLDALARKHSISRGTADNELKRAFAAIRVHLVDDPDLETVVEKIFEIAFMDDGESDD